MNLSETLLAVVALCASPVVIYVLLRMVGDWLDNKKKHRRFPDDDGDPPINIRKMY